MAMLPWPTAMCSGKSPFGPGWLISVPPKQVAFDLLNVAYVYGSVQVDCGFGRLVAPRQTRGQTEKQQDEEQESHCVWTGAE